MILKNLMTSNSYFNSFFIPYSKSILVFKGIKKMLPDSSAGYFYYFNFENKNYVKKINAF